MVRLFVTIVAVAAHLASGPRFSICGRSVHPAPEDWPRSKSEQPLSASIRERETGITISLRRTVAQTIERRQRPEGIDVGITLQQPVVNESVVQAAVQLRDGALVFAESSQVRREVEGRGASVPKGRGAGRRVE